MSGTLKVAQSAYDAMRKHAESDFPEECCGMMLGRDLDDGSREVVEIIEINNEKDENRKRRYLIEPKAILHAERTAREKKMDVVGIYHSHPNHPSQASEFDKEHAMPFWSYLIVSCIEGEAKQVQSWLLREDRSQFDEQVIEVV